METLPRLDRSKAMKTSLASQGDGIRVVDHSMVDRLNMVWLLTIASWSIKDRNIAASRLQRHVVRVHRLSR
ncbi:MAG: hypothetical protein ACK5PB_23285 [Pirellula sp.]|jgi:hypothetical protein